MVATIKVPTLVEDWEELNSNYLFIAFKQQQTIRKICDIMHKAWKEFRKKHYRF